MAEEKEGGGGGAMSGTVTLPGVGPTQKKTVAIVGGVAAAFVLWRFWQARAAADEVVPGDSDGDGYADGGTLPSVSGAVSPDNSYGRPEEAPAGTDSFGFRGTTNAQWAQYAATQLAGASDKWSYGDVVEALGAYISNRPLTATQQQIVQAAIGLAGQLPEGQKAVIPGGDVPITVAPSGLRVASTTSTTATLTWSAVAGAASYRVIRSDGNGSLTAAGTSATVTGLKPNTATRFQVAAVTASGKSGPNSPPVSGTTKAVTLAKPGGVKVSAVTRTNARVAWLGVTGASGYRVYINGALKNQLDSSARSYTVTGLKPNSAYKVSVRADADGQPPGPESGQVSFRTKK